MADHLTSCLNGGLLTPTLYSPPPTFCDCKRSSLETAYAGLRCEYPASSYCIQDASGGGVEVVNKISFCTNGGQCANIISLVLNEDGNFNSRNASHGGCLCPQGWAGPYCGYEQSKLPTWHEFPTERNPSSQRAILESLYESTNGSNWSNQDNWMDDTVHECEWYGISCQHELQVDRMELRGNGLRGDIPDVVYGLPQMRRVDLSENDIDMNFGRMWSWTALSHLNLSDSRLTSVDGIWSMDEYWYSALEVLDLSNNTLQTMIDEEQVLKWTNLRELHLASASIYGTLPPFPLTKLTWLNLFDNELTGPIPSEFGWLVNLEVMDLSRNAMSGTIPTEMLTLEYLTDLRLDDNYLSGTIPAEIGNLERLESLSLARNYLSGLLPPTLLAMTNLTYLSISQQKGGGIIGPLLDFSNQKDLEELQLDGNFLGGEIPNTFLLAASRTEPIYVDLRGNSLVGEVPSHLGDFVGLTIELGDNEIGGFGGSTKLCSSSFMDGDVQNFGCDGLLCPVGTYSTNFGRQISADDPCLACESTTSYGSINCNDSESAVVPDDGSAIEESTVAPGDSLAERDILTEFYKSMSGPNWYTQTNWNENNVGICDWFGITCADDGLHDDSPVAKIELPANHLEGLVPSTLFALPHLKVLDLSDNSVGLQPGVLLKDAVELKELYLSNTSTISLHGIESATMLQILDVSNNRINDRLEDDLLMTNLRVLNLSSTGLTGEFRTVIGEMISLQVLDLSANALGGEIPDDPYVFQNLKNLTKLILGNNRFSGRLPQSFEYLKSLEVLSLDNQKAVANTDVGISGPLPPYKDLQKLRELRVNGNSISGEVPKDLLGNSIVTSGRIYINLASNDLRGDLPDSLGRFKELTIHVEDNQIEYIPDALCNMPDWMGGLVNTFGCDAILCPPRTFNAEHGKLTSTTSICSQCPELLVARFFGSLECLEPKAGSGSEPRQDDCVVDGVVYNDGASLGHIPSKCVNGSAYIARDSSCRLGKIKDEWRHFSCPQEASQCTRRGSAFCVDPLTVGNGSESSSKGVIRGCDYKNRTYEASNLMEHVPIACVNATAYRAYNLVCADQEGKTKIELMERKCAPETHCVDSSLEFLNQTESSNHMEALPPDVTNTTNESVSNHLSTNTLFHGGRSLRSPGESKPIEYRELLVAGLGNTSTFCRPRASSLSSSNLHRHESASVHLIGGVGSGKSPGGRYETQHEADGEAELKLPRDAVSQANEDRYSRASYSLITTAVLLISASQ